MTIAAAFWRRKFVRLPEGAARLFEVEAGTHLPNDNIDVGTLTNLGEYHLADTATDRLLDTLAKKQFSGTSAELGRAILAHYESPASPHPAVPAASGTDIVQTELQQLKAHMSGVSPDAISH